MSRPLFTIINFKGRLRRILRTLIIITSTVSLFFLLFSCSLTDTNPQDFLIRVDSIQVPDTVTSSISFEIKFFGTIGGDGCHSFKTFNQFTNSNTVVIEAWGTLDRKSQECPAVMVSLNGHNFTLTLLDRGIYYINIAEPDNSLLIKKIFVR